MSSVAVIPYSNDWPQQFSRIRAELTGVFSGEAIQVEHIGSTAVPSLAAKPVIDVLLGADTLDAIEARAKALGRCGYQYISKYERELPTRRYFTKAGTSISLRTHLHAVVIGSQLWQEHIAFRDALRSDGSLRAQYQSLKIELANKFSQDKASYTAAKEPFIRSALNSLQQGWGADTSFKPNPLRGSV